MKIFSRGLAACGALVLLAGCGAGIGKADPTSSSSTYTEAPTASPFVSELLPHPDHLVPLAETRVAPSGMLSAVTDSRVLVTVEPDLAQGVTVLAGHEGSRETWRKSFDGLLVCDGGESITCVAGKESEAGYTAENAFILDASDGTMGRLSVGPSGTFDFLGLGEKISYFLTWDGTSDVHLTGFDPTGAPVADQKISMRAPDSPTAMDAYGHVADDVVVFASQDSTFVFLRRAGRVFTVAGRSECLSLSDGALCEHAGHLYGLGASTWRVPSDRRVLGGSSGGSLADAEKKLAEIGRVEPLKMREVTDFLKTPSPDAGEALSDEPREVLVGGIQGVVFGQASRGSLVLDGTPIDLAGGALVSVDAGSDLGVISTSYVASSGEGSEKTIDSSILLGRSGSVLTAPVGVDQAGIDGEDYLDAQVYEVQERAVVYLDQATGIAGLYAIGPQKESKG